ncbi:GMC oxidoreductase [Croceicoccus mobilis]|uniref:2-keto-gluconate dehydrogenase subunit n=1 Tax=Croceicoccus mobilis TaxID=1703339 RepID=A0A916YTA7_9SPHN|nr:GMC family oxidoreductase [Croceicoccus mobilis]GGD59314.1 2-keto-gluconate dehydrogenase subunit [Croceicoccus mobilis]
MKFVEAQHAAAEHWDVVVVGSGFGAVFFLQKYLEHRPGDRVLVLERGRHNRHDWQLAFEENSDIEKTDVYARAGNDKEWDFTIGLGGSTNCWWGLTPRLHPRDFDIFTRTGVGADWPVRYDDLVPFYQQAEQTMMIAGSDELDAIYPGTKYVQPAHHLTTADEMIRARPGHHHYPMPTAKLSRAVGSRGRCCSNSTCNLCPTEAKFTALNGMQPVFSHPAVSICLKSTVEMLDVADGVVKSVKFSNAGRDYTVKCDLCVMGANAMQSPFIMLRSGIGGHGLGRYFGEKMLARIEVKLDGLDHFDGGTAATALNLSLLQEERDASRGSAVYIFDNSLYPGLRLDPPGRWRQTLPVEVYAEDLFDYDNGVFDEGGDRPVIRFKPWSDFAMRTLDHAMEALPGIVSALPVEEVGKPVIKPTLGHMQGTCRMGTNIENSVIDSDLIAHSTRNLVVVGTSIFPTAGSANPSLSAAALSLRAADRMWRQEA